MANPLLRKLGLSDNDRVVIFHADDIGMCHSSLAAYQDLVEFGLISSAATMVPCAWFPATAVFCRENQSTRPIDMGVHATLTCEWSHYRWGPISAPVADAGLRDADGYFYQDCESVQANAQVDAVVKELTMQVERALSAGIDVTHIDSHMGCVFHPKFLPAYVQLAQTYQIPAFLLRPDVNDEFIHDEEREFMETVFAQLQALEETGFPVLDKLAMMPLDHHENRLEDAKRLLGELPAGVHYFLLHPSIDTPELRAITPDWQARVGDYKLFMSDAWRQEVESSGVKVVGWRVIRDR